MKPAGGHGTCKMHHGKQSHWVLRADVAFTAAQQGDETEARGDREGGAGGLSR